MAVLYRIYCDDICRIYLIWRMDSDRLKRLVPYVLRYGMASSDECIPICMANVFRMYSAIHRRDAVFAWAVKNSRGCDYFTPILYIILCTVNAVILATNCGILTMYKMLYKQFNVWFRMNGVISTFMYVIVCMKTSEIDIRYTALCNDEKILKFPPSA